MIRHLLLLLMLTAGGILARPMVRNIRSTHEFDRLLEKHAKETGLPVVVDFYSDGCGPCRMMAPIFKKMAGELGQDKVVFVKVDTNVQRELAGRYRIQSLPTFAFFLGGKKWNQFSGAGEGQLRQMTQQVIRQSELDNVKMELDALQEYYKKVEPSKTKEDIEKVYTKCVEMIKSNNKDGLCLGSAANQLARRLKKKYGSAPTLLERFDASAKNPSKSKEEGGGEKKSSSGSSSSGSTSAPTNNNKSAPNLHLATEEQLLEELEKRKADEEDDDDDEEEEELFPLYSGVSDFPERVVIVGGGPAGLSAAIYAARAGLEPVVVAPAVGGQLQGKGVVVENFPGIFSPTQEWLGPEVVLGMKRQASAYGAVFEHSIVTEVDTSERPFRVTTQKEFDNSTTAPIVIPTHSIIVATGAESNWLNIPGEQELRGGGVSSCATCDGNLYKSKHVVVVGGGDAAMEDALVLARTSASVKIIHRRDSFRASKVLAQRVLEHPNIQVVWNTIVTEIVGTNVQPDGDSEDESDVNLDDSFQIVSAAKLKNTQTGETSTLSTDAVFVAIGHTPTTQFLEGIVDFNPNHAGYVRTLQDGSSTKTSVAGIFACGDVSDAIYRQAITSAGSGAAAALDAERWLSEEGLGNEAAEFEAELLAELLKDGDTTKDGANDSSATYNAYAEASGVGRKESINAMGSEL
uniref:Thioredoxin domain-containing protein n=1 Tax=Grammatophora oceanica TaxID=210454 RepID=A0A7S1V572_9STRA|mmetsp:Transcript_35446/g.52749  ORF Transcript_35446/g.52749 Transcript_35446/m.52749 type:complete len:689 (+) Transcript_35446:86-2152(+)|eukprot:CAMPEP_0194039358 /NCGR_PEP_ID=MMETSP0009_2-20130614/11500_1 /TAXON_ID=210454 /ORGANISM="Grammatophora oceanica, Strain CCMP 410" /LENGTH=688 /DNA_ID=CAMNT_0038682179 /DNA_START=86 /DNA_END=2152 /DNA_ORIENTATION=-